MRSMLTDILIMLGISILSDHLTMVDVFILIDDH